MRNMSAPASMRCASSSLKPIAQATRPGWRAAAAESAASCSRAPLAQHAVQPAAELFGLDLARVSRAHRADGVRIDEAALQERKPAVELDALDGEGRARQLESLE